MGVETKLPRAPARMTPGFAFSYVERCIKESLTMRQFGVPEMKLIVSELFDGDPECVYCGSSDVSRWDHLFPVARGGDTVIGNMVLACARCDDSKQASPYADWILSDARYSPKSRGVPDLDARIARIQMYVEAHAYSPRSIEKRLTRGELKRLETIRGSAAILRSELKALVQDVRARTGDQ